MIVPLCASILALPVRGVAPVQLIIDTDLGFDVDDVGAIAVAHALADQGHVDLVGVVCNTGRDACIVGVDVVNTYYGRGSTPIGSFKGKFGSYTDNGQDWHYVNDIKSKFPHRVNGRDDVPSALDVYRSALTAAANRSITIASIGELTNLQELLRAEPQLVRAKVKRVVYMDGDFNFGCADGTYGPSDECWKSAQLVVANMPSPEVEQIFQLHGDNHNGWWVGHDPKCGYDAHNPVKVAYADMCAHSWGGACDNYGRDSWDPNTVYAAVMGAAGGGKCAIGSGRACAYSVSDDGRSEYRDYNDHSKNMFDFSLIGDISAVGNTIETLLCQPPKLNQELTHAAAPKLTPEAAALLTGGVTSAARPFQYTTAAAARNASEPVSARKGPAVRVHHSLVEEAPSANGAKEANEVGQLAK